MIAVLAPMEAEIRGIIDQFEKLPDTGKGEPPPHVEKSLHSLRVVWYGTVVSAEKGREDLLLGASGVGKVQSALAVEELISNFSPRLLLFGGIGGGIDPGLEVGSIVVADQCVQWDMNAGAVGTKRGKTPFMPFIQGTDKRGVIKLEGEPVERAVSLRAEDPTMWRGRIATGDTFVGGKDVGLRSMLREELSAIAVDMEGWSVAYVCTLHRTPLLLVRVVSDTGEGRRGKNIRRFIDSAGNSLGRLFTELLTRYY